MVTSHIKPLWTCILLKENPEDKLQIGTSQNQENIGSVQEIFYIFIYCGLWLRWKRKKIEVESE